MIVRFLSVLCLGVLVASVYSADANNDNEGKFYPLIYFDNKSHFIPMVSKTV